MNTQLPFSNLYSFPLYSSFPAPSNTIKYKNDCKPERLLVCGLHACNLPISWRWRRDDLAKAEGVYRTRSEETMDDGLLVNRLFIVSAPRFGYFLCFSLYSLFSLL